MRDELERLLLWHIKAAGLPTPEREVRLVPGRRFKWDVVWRANMVAVEVNGGTWIKGGHSTGTGIERDYEKSNLATLLGWHCFAFSGAMVKDGRAVKIIKEALDYFPPF